ncbi:BZ3500_MvSof-1268-A1-R1_Chr1-3g01571 [Microbotryum saponariae]|uniref:BZ3500_MvSof-1268-A1-R1_Chr1-3g01571 protein n=1 Tax=Microbotryum saponariae TaxID=289078 RepID=A0A2X0MIK8_9BASI|nr:BZ3500_MvSof-1268-A1-R1_Chr1-3g01571 [Microbotryum saponariae]SCZ94060.1 BZ3501_MvSof-1269-A2-R1_Chr1-3g01173 [Microbotryum saponariae]
MTEVSPTPRDELLSRQPSTLSSLIAGSAGGMAQVLVGQPLVSIDVSSSRQPLRARSYMPGSRSLDWRSTFSQDTIKTRAQTAPRGAFKGPLDIALQTIKKEGILALYKGMVSPLIGVAGVNSLLFGANQQARKLVSPYPDLSLAQVVVAGAMAGAAQSVLASPVEMFKVRMQAQYGPNPKRLRETVGEMHQKWGWKRGIMRGYWITVLREIPAYGGFYLGYEYSKRTFQTSLHTTELPVWATLTSGAVGGIAYWTAWYVLFTRKSDYPLDVVKSRIQLQDQPPRGINYITATFAKIYREEGSSAFVRGITPTYIRAVPAAASTFVAFEIVSSLLQKHTTL